MNRAMLHIAAGQPGKALDLFDSHREGTTDILIEGFRALAIARQGSIDVAKAALLKAERQVGQHEVFNAIRENIDTRRPYFASPNVEIDVVPLSDVRHALAHFHRLGHVDQAQLLRPQGGYEEYLMDEVRGACGSLTLMAPMMRNLGQTTHEDDITGMLQQLLISRLLFQNWTVTDQSRGGYSAKLGVGERDLVVKKGTAELAVIEALVVHSVEKDALTSHFRKLYAYSSCNVFFHISYVMNSNCTAVLDFMREECSTPPNPEVKLMEVRQLPDSDSNPMGFEAFYEAPGRICYVVFLALDMGQANMKKAAASQHKK